MLVQTCKSLFLMVNTYILRNVGNQQFLVGIDFYSMEKKNTMFFWSDLFFDLKKARYYALEFSNPDHWISYFLTTPMEWIEFTN